MRSISFIRALLISMLISACSSPKKISIWVFDNQQILTPQQINSLDSLYKSHEKRTTNEVVLVTTPGYGADTTLLEFAVNFGRKYGIGKQDKNNGVVIVFNGVERQTMISTGYGTEKVLKDEIAKKIIDSLMIPGFRQDKIFYGLWEGSKAIIEFLERPENKIK